MVQLDFEESHTIGNYGSANYSASNDWTHVAETTIPLRTSKLDSANHGQFLASLEVRSKQISAKVIGVNLVSLLANLLLAIIAFYFSFAIDSASMTAFAADCVLDFISSAILLWRYHGDLNSVYMHAREQIACIYLGALFEISAFAIIVKSISDIASGTDLSLDISETTSDSSILIYLAIVATLTCSILTVFKCALYKILRDRSILLDVINTLISAVFALSIVMSQALININPSFWYLDPVLSIVLALFMAGFGIRVIHQNFNVLKPVYSNYEHNINLSVGLSRTNWQKTDYSTINFV